MDAMVLGSKWGHYKKCTPWWLAVGQKLSHRLVYIDSDTTLENVYIV